MSGLMAVYSVVFRTGVLGVMLTMLTCVNEVTVVFAQGSADRLIEKVTTQATETTMQRAAAKAAKEETAQAELKAKRPEALKGPTTLHFMVFVVGIDDIERPKILPPMCICVFAEKMRA